MFEAALAIQRDSGGDRRFDTRVGHTYKAADKGETGNRSCLEALESGS